MQITLKNLSRNYGSLHAVSGVSLEVPSNKIFGIIGRSGAGKSTLVRLISLLEKPDTGEVWYDDKRVDNLSEKELILQRRRLGMIFQNFNLFSSRNAGENVAYPMEICGVEKDKIKARVKELMELVELGDRIDAPISTLSGGQKQRVAIARALACEPDILFCDEATSALDPQTTRAILKLIREIQKKMNLTVIMITHQMEVVRDSCDFVTVLSDGAVVESGTVKDIFSKPKSEVTKDFLAHLTTTDQDKDSTVHWSKIPGRYTLRFVSGNTDSPIISRLSKEFDVEFNIRGGGVQKVGNDEYGTLICDITGEEEAVKKTVAKLKRHKITVEEAL
ncbi:MAG: methionine ABC transporter ATP-binding protein [Sphaerochaetaceae bacterium]|nr:methionine ABC transporter ATP-binding protein [Sphaerochaetaceae bacterium]